MRWSGLIKGLSAAVAMGTLSLGATGASACGATYKVERGDHLGRIAKDCGVSVQSILKANKLRDPSLLRVGQELQIPGGSEQGGAAAKTAVKSPEDMDELKGQIINGRYCAQIVTADGERFGLVSPKLAFTSGKIVTVQGSMHKYAGCTPDKTMLVSVILEDGVDASDVSATADAANLTN